MVGLPTTRGDVQVDKGTSIGEVEGDTGTPCSSEPEGATSRPAVGPQSQLSFLAVAGSDTSSGAAAIRSKEGPAIEPCDRPRPVVMDLSG